MSVSGHWEGKLVDVTGLAALIAFDLTDVGGDVRGDFSITLLPEAGSCSEPSGPPQVQTGSVEGRADEASGRVELRYRVATGPQLVAVSVDGRLVGALPHARQAILGCFEIQEGFDRLTLEDGGAVLWQYEGGG
jgi:hypothetical protein